MPKNLVPTELATVMMVSLLTAAAGAQEKRKYYEPSTWVPRVILPAADALSGTFFPPSPPVQVDYSDAEFDDTRLSPPPPPGVHPRVLLTPADAEVIRSRIKQGDRAPLEFRTMWTRVSRKQNALYAYIAQDNALGARLAQEFMEKVRSLGPKLDAMETYPDRENLWTVEKSMAAAGDPLTPSDIWQLPNYDLLYQWLSEDERALVRQTIARVTRGRTSNFMAVPDHYMIDNHQCFGMSFMPLLLCIEGEEGFDDRVYRAGVHKMRAMLDYYITRDGTSYETIKSWLPTSAYVAVARRERDLLKHSHLRAKIDFFLQSVRWEMPNLARPMVWQPPGGADAGWRLRDEMRASAFHVIWMMKYFRPQSRPLDFLYNVSLSSHAFLTDAEARWPDPVGIDEELLLLFAGGANVDQAGKPIDWRAQSHIDSLKLPLTWHDDQRGYLVARNSWRKDDLAVNFACKSEYYYGGHEGAEHGRFAMWADGINWAVDNDSLFYKHGALQNQITVDGLSMRWPPVAGQWLGVRDTPKGVSASGDNKDGYSFYKSTQIHPLDFPSASTTYTSMFSTGNYTLSRSTQLAYHDEMVKFYDGYAHTDYGTWSGEHRLLDGYRPWNPMRRAFRTLQLGRGEKPYVLVIDDVQKDDTPREYAWNMVLPDDVQLLSVTGAPDMLGGIMPSDEHAQIDLILGRITTPRNATNRIWTQPLFVPTKGDPQLLVRVLRRKTVGWTLPRVEQIERFNVLCIPAHSTSPDYVVLLFPHRAGDPLPRTAWSADGESVRIEVGSTTDVYHLRKTDAGRTVFSMVRHGDVVQKSNEPPAAPNLIVRGDRSDRSDLRYTRQENTVPRYLFTETMKVAFDMPAMNTRVHYTVDGTDPTPESPRYRAPIEIDNSVTLKARVIDPEWPCGPQESAITTAVFEKRAPAEPISGLGKQSGLLAQVFELKTVIYDNKGFWRAGRVMLPDLRREVPLLSTITSGFDLPHAEPAAPYIEQRKGFYRFTGLFRAPETGVYQFSVDSCGPITLDIGGQTAIEHTGQFHQQQDVRRGEVTLRAGWHTIELVVTDPLFWKINTDDAMPFSVTYRVNGGPSQTIAADQLSCDVSAEAKLSSAPLPPQLNPAEGLPEIEAGVERRDFNRSDLFRVHAPPRADWFDLDSATPIEAQNVDVIVPNTGDSLISQYDGYFYAPEPGVYTFDLPARADEHTTGDQVRTGDAADRNQLRLCGQVIVQRGIPGRHPLRKAFLSAPGYYPISIRLGKSRAGGSVTYPSGQTLALTASGLFRISRPRIAPIGETNLATHYELYQPARVEIRLPASSKATDIRYTVDGTEPTSASPLYASPIEISQDQTVMAAGFSGESRVTDSASATFNQTDRPEEGLMVLIDGSKLAPTRVTGANVWFDPAARLLQSDGESAISLHGGSAGAKKVSAATRPVDANLDKGNSGAGLRLLDLKLPRNAITVAMRVRVADATQGRLFGKWGYNSIGKRWRSVLCEVRDGKLHVEPGPIRGGAFKANTWHHVALVADSNQMLVYLDGKLVAQGDGTDAVSAGTFDFGVNLAADVADVRVYNRPLREQDIRALAK